MIQKESPTGADLALLFARHTADMHTDTPPESIHMMDAGELDVPQVHFFVLRENAVPVAMGAFKIFDGTHAEIKSMHVLAEHRGRGLSHQMLAHLVAAAQAAGVTRLSLETGSQEAFTPARVLYEKAGFTRCPPFGDYVLDPMSIFMTRTLA
ncbi:MAG: GNAT family N-acetyltransferase [Pseudomonadota bacterium]